MARDPKAEVEISAHSRNLGAKLREARQKFGAFGAELKKEVFGKDLVEKGFWGKAGAHLVANLGSNAIGGALDFLGGQAKAAYQFQDALVRLQITAEKTPEDMQRLAQTVREASDATGIGKDKILAASHAYVALTGDMDTAAASTASWARIAQATNSSVEDIAKTAAAMGQNMQIGPKEMEESFAALAIQGKKGAIELKDLAAELSQIAPQWAMFGRGTGVQGVRELGAALQVVKRGFGGDAAETVTGLQSMLTAITKNSARFQHAGIKIFDVDPKTHTKTMRSVLDIVQDIGNSKLVKNPTALEKAFGRVEAYRAFLQLTQNKAALDDLISSSRDVGVIQRDLDTYMNSTAGKTSRAWEMAKNAIADVFTPERIKLFSEALVKAVELFGKIVGYIDRTAKFVSDVIDKVQGPSAEQRADKVAKSVIAYDKQQQAGLSDETANNPAVAKLNRESYARLAKQEYRKYGELMNQDTKSVEDQRDMIAAQKLALYYQDQADPWGGGGQRGRKIDFSKGYDPNVLKHMSKDDYAKIQEDAAGAELKHAVVDAIREGFKAVDKRPVDLKVGADPLVRATSNAPRTRTRPGG